MKWKVFWGRFFGSVLFLALWVLFSSAAQAATIYVGGSSDPYQDIQPAIDAAQNGDEIIVRDGVYAPPGTDGINFKRRGITLRSENGPGNCIIDGGNSKRGFSGFGRTSESKIDGFTIQHCKVPYRGGGIYCDVSSSPTIANCTFSDNASDDGGGISCNHSSPTITNCTFIRNRAYRNGGGIYCLVSSPTITNCTFLRWNEAYNGGGISCVHSSPIITNCTLSGNRASYGGGGISCSTFSFPTITNCTLSENDALFGRGIYCSSCFPTITNCILWRSGIYSLGDSSPSVTYSNIQEGYAGEGNIDLDPQFVDAYKGGDLHLKAGSPSIDAGINTAPSIPEKDKDGANRIVDGNGDGTTTVDMGAYEYQGAETSVELAYFRAVRFDGIIRVKWKTASETDNAGFHVWRSRRSNGTYARITEGPIPAEGSPFEGARYSFKDAEVEPEKAYFYKLEDIDIDGARTFHGPVKVRDRR